MDIIVIMELDVFHTLLYVMDIHHVVMDLMKDLVVRYICTYNMYIIYHHF